MWTVPREWEGQTAFIVGGGPSVAGLNLELLRGRKVIVINSSCYRIPWADILYFGDTRWWREHKPAVESFAGRVVTVSSNDSKRVLRLAKAPIPPVPKNASPKLSANPGELAQRRTSLTAAINLAAHLGVCKIVLLGIDGKPDDEWLRTDGKQGLSHHHAPHPWTQRKDCWDEQRQDLATIAPQLTALNIEIVNANPNSAIDLWPRVRSEDALWTDPDFYRLFSKQ